MLSNSLIAIIARVNPQIWEIVGGGPGVAWQRVGLAALNPQPLPPGERGGLAALNPQPLPPKALGYGAAVGVELVRAATIAQLLGVAFEPGDDICPPPRKWPHIPIPFPWPPEPYPWRDGDDAVREYAAGLAFALEASAIAWEGLGGAGALERLHDVAMETATSRGEAAG